MINELKYNEKTLHNITYIKSSQNSVKTGTNSSNISLETEFDTNLSHFYHRFNKICLKSGAKQWIEYTEVRVDYALCSLVIIEPGIRFQYSKTIPNVLQNMDVKALLASLVNGYSDINVTVLRAFCFQLPKESKVDCRIRSSTREKIVEPFGHEKACSGSNCMSSYKFTN